MHNAHLKTTYLLKEEIKELYLTSAIHGFSIALVAIFIPIFLLQSGFTLLQVILYAMTQYALAAVSSYFAVHYAAQNGVKHSMIVSIPFFVVFFLMLYNAQALLQYINSYLFLFIIALCTAISGSYYWMGWHIEFAKFSEKKSAKQIGVMNIISTLMSVIGPLAGAFIITRFGFLPLFILVIILLCISMFPLFMSKDYHMPIEFKVEKLFTLKQIKSGLPFIGEGFEGMAMTIFWPVLLYLLFISLESIGGLYALSNAILVLLTFYLSKKITIFNRHKLMKIGAYTHSLTVMFRVFFKAVYAIFIVQGLGSITWVFLDLPFRSLFYDISKDKGITWIIFYREVYLNMGRALSLIIMALLLIFFTGINALIITIIISGFIMLTMMLLGKKMPIIEN